ncbi:MAG: hypothetical protein DRI61_10995 [Chloroflexi bacterium]|nr:MAG: hypothetical protein DRI61_10995 [Chloroflexota bacterium]
MYIIEEIKKIEREIEEIRKYVNDMSHTVGKLEEDIRWIKFVLKWGLTLIAFLIGMSIGL